MVIDQSVDEPEDLCVTPSTLLEMALLYLPCPAAGDESASPLALGNPPI